MKKLLAIAALSLNGQFALADDCDFDQASRVDANIALTKKYPGSFLIDEKLVLVVPVDDGEVRINIGGCTHYGVLVELWTKTPDKYKSEEAFMRQVVRLAQVYSQGHVEPEKLKNVIKKRSWLQPEATKRVYFLQYDETSTFEVYERQEGQRIVIGFSMYS